jgi:hypothetical protein
MPFVNIRPDYFVPIFAGLMECLEVDGAEERE